MSNNLKDIARELGLSVSTISRVVNGKTYVAPETKKRVLDALKKHPYTPNQVARSLKTQSTSTVGIIVPDIRDYFANVIKGADAVFSQYGYSIILADTNESSEKEELYLKVLYEKRIDGLVLATVAKEHESLSLFLNNSIPVVYIDNLPNLDISYDAVLLDNVKASIMAANHLISGGHKKIAIVCGEQSETTTTERVLGYKQALESNGLNIDPDLIKFGDYKYETGYQCMLELLDNRQSHDFTAVFITSYKMTCGAMKAMKERGVRYPEDIALVGFDFPDDLSLFSPQITTILQPIDSIGKLVAARLIEKMKNVNLQGVPDIPQRILLDPILKIGESCGCKK